MDYWTYISHYLNKSFLVLHMLKIRMQSIDMYIPAMQFADNDMAGKHSMATACPDRQTIRL
jgi:uncharacterized Fe-S radical SAM superfamily protein PflX